MAVRLGSAPKEVTHEVKFLGPGGSHESFIVGYKYRTTSDYIAFFQEAASINAVDELSEDIEKKLAQVKAGLEASADFIFGIISSWDLKLENGEVAPVTREIIVVLLDQYMNVGAALIDGYGDALRGAREKN